MDRESVILEAFETGTSHFLFRNSMINIESLQSSLQILGELLFYILESKLLHFDVKHR